MGRRMTPELRAKYRRGALRARARQRALALVRPRDLDHLRRSGTVAKSVRPFLDAADLEAQALLVAYEGAPDSPHHRPLSAPRRVLLEDAVRAGVIMRAELGRFVQAHDSEAGSRALTAMGHRRTILRELGLEALEHAVNDYAAALLAAEASRAIRPEGGVAGSAPCSAASPSNSAERARSAQEQSG